MRDHQQQRYRVVERLASGGMAEVFLAESAGIEGFSKQVAIKRVLPHLSERKRFIAMFLDEARLSAQLSHSNVVQVFDVGVGDNTYFIVMEYVDGADLKAVINHLKSLGRPFPVEAAILIATKICEGLAYAHERADAQGEPLNIVHRDISPPNVLISKFGEVKIVDFGLAKASTQLAKSEAGIVKGKFGYLSPEAAFGSEVDLRADIFAVGIILWEMLAGQRLFAGQTDYETIKLVQKAKVPSITKLNGEVPPQLERILARALARAPKKRYESARALGQDLTRLLFSISRPIGAFDLAELSRGAMLMRKRLATEGSSLIEKLIQETLFEFTSLAAGEGSSADLLAQRFSLTGFEAIRIERHGPETAQSTLLVRRTLPEDAFEEGNLAALEGPDELEPAPGRRRGSSAPPEPAPEAPAAAGAASAGDAPAAACPAPAPEPSERPAPLAPLRCSSPPPCSVPAPASIRPSAAPPAPAAGYDTVLRLLLVVVILAAVAAALWFGGLV
ncbi:MAG: serine/threonine protein kinase [Deltaproteobacteria bacterium]|nr:serine/threonine protein kinase [Deltaproteobacteria bacterium]